MDTSVRLMFYKGAMTDLKPPAGAASAASLIQPLRHRRYKLTAFAWIRAISPLPLPLLMLMVLAMSLSGLPAAGAAVPGSSASESTSVFSPADDKQVRRVVQEQLLAFAKDEAAKAFSYAAPNIREAMGSADNFMRMVRQSYPVIYRPASVAFLKIEGSGNEAVQRVQMLDAAGDSWLAVYSLQRQKGRQWRISGCVVLQNKGRMA